MDLLPRYQKVRLGYALGVADEKFCSDYVNGCSDRQGLPTPGIEGTPRGEILTGGSLSGSGAILGKCLTGR